MSYRNLDLVDLPSENESSFDARPVRKLAGMCGGMNCEYAIWHVVQDVGNGLGFPEAFKKEYASDYVTAYSQFLKYFY
jgi:hypothetical protein